MSVANYGSYSPAHAFTAGTGRGLWNPEKTMIVIRDPIEHSHRRKIWNRGFNTTAIKETVMPVIQSRTQQLVECLSQREGQVIDIAQWFGFFTYDFMGDIMCVSQLFAVCDRY